MPAGRVVTSRAHYTDEQLVLAAQGGDTAAADVITSRFDGYVKAITRGYFDASGSDDDLFQEARFGLMKATRDWRPDAGASFKTFVSICVNRQVLTHVKWTTRTKHAQLTHAVRVALTDEGDRVDVLDTIAAQRTDPAEVVADRDRFTALVAVLRDRMSPLEFDATVGFFFNGDTYEEIAARRGGTAKSIDNAIMRARGKLRLALDLPEPRPLGVAV